MANSDDIQPGSSSGTWQQNFAENVDAIDDLDEEALAELDEFYQIPATDIEAIRRLDLHQVEMRRLESIRKMREAFAFRMFLMLAVWLLAMFTLLVLVGGQIKLSFMHNDAKPFMLSDGVLGGLIAATGLFGLITLILRNLFPAAESTDTKGSK